MNPVLEEELSALLDGELEAERAAEVVAQIAADPVLHAQYQMLAALDAQLSSVAQQARFAPYITLPMPVRSQSDAWFWPTMAASALALLVVRFAPRLSEQLLMGVAVQIAACVGIALLVLRLVRAPDPLDGKGIPT